MVDNNEHNQGIKELEIRAVSQVEYGNPKMFPDRDKLVPEREGLYRRRPVIVVVVVVCLDVSNVKREVMEGTVKKKWSSSQTFFRRAGKR